MSSEKARLNMFNMRKASSRKIKRWSLIIMSVYIVIGLLLYFFQEKILFHPERVDRAEAYQFEVPFREINLAVTETKNLNIVQFYHPDSSRKGVVLYFHGNRKNIKRYAGYADNFIRNNYEVWMIDYPGFGKSTGELTEDAMYKDAALLYKMARAKFSKDSIVIYGKSLGSGVAAQLASTHDCRALLMETPYYSMDNLVKHYAFIYPVKLLSKYRFPTSEYLKTVDAPISMFHGTKDEIIPFSQSAKLAKEFPRIQLVPIEKGRHNNLDEFSQFHESLNAVLRK
jgi:alpha-beta hydrolase superfamily lysophospholipase